MSTSLIIQPPTFSSVLHVYRGRKQCNVVSFRVNIKTAQKHLGTNVIDEHVHESKAHVTLVRCCLITTLTNNSTDTCIAVWATGNWGACTHTCGDYGVQYRVLTCVWHGTNKPAGRFITVALLQSHPGTFCQTAQKPAISRPCADQPSCPSGGAYVGNALLWHAHNKNLQHWRGLTHLNNIYRHHAGYSNHYKPSNTYA